MGRHAKASSAGSTTGRGNRLGSVRRAFAARGASGDANGSGAPAGRWRPALLVLAASFAFALLAAPAALASGTVNVTINGAGSGTVTSTTNGSGGPINCHYNGSSQSGTCSAAFTGGEFGVITTITLTATGDPHAGYLTGWSQSGADGSVVGCTTPPQVEPTCKVTITATNSNVTATFGIPPNPPIATTGGTSAIADTQATMEGTVDPEEFTVAGCYFEYGTTTAYGASAPCIPAAGTLTGTSPVAVSAQTEPVEGGTNYHYRLVALNVGGETQGEDHTFATTGSPACPNAAIRREQGIGAILLPECMALEQVSPPVKASQPAKGPMVSASGERVVFISSATLGNSVGHIEVDPYVATRTGSGWETYATRPPLGMNSQWFSGAESFNPEFSRWLQFAGTISQSEVGAAQAFEEGFNGFFAPLSPIVKPQSGGEPYTVKTATLTGISTDHSHFYFTRGINTGGGGFSSTGYLLGDPEDTGSGAVGNSYVAHRNAEGEPTLELVARDAQGKIWGGNCGAGLVKGRGTVSTDGTHAFFTTRPAQPPSSSAVFCNTANPLRILKRVETSDGPWISELIQSECTRAAPPCKTEAELNGDDVFKAASLDQSKVYFVSPRQLANSDLDTTSDLYLYDTAKPLGHRLTQVSAGGSGDATPGSGANVGSSNVIAISTDGSRAYFTSNAVLTTAKNPAGVEAQSGQSNLYLYEATTGALSFIGTGSAESAYPVPMTGSDPQVGGDGHILVFTTKASLTSEDADGGRRDIYRYDSSAAPPTLTCISCHPGAPDSEPFDVTSDVGGASGNNRNVGTDFAEVQRTVSEDGDTITFVTAESLSPDDRDGAASSYLWRDGRFVLLPGAFAESLSAGATPGRLSHDGAEVAYVSEKQVLPSDGDTTSDIYVARVDGGFKAPVIPTPCQGEACQEPFTAQPGTQGTATESSQPNGNAPEPTTSCHKGYVRKHGRCVKKSNRRKKRAHRKAQTRHANTNRRAAK